MTTRLMHFTLGPVQGFIADARRLRDYWAGSFILSLLSGHAMVAAKNAGARILFPLVEGDPLFQAILDNDSQANVYVGSLPNRFKADVSECRDDIPETCKRAIEAAWSDICQTIWDRYVASAAGEFHGKQPHETNRTKRIWKRQTERFWEIAWVVGEDDGENGTWLDMRKNWRRVDPNRAEHEDLCRVMGIWQELSGVTRFTDGSQASQREFWNAVRNTARVSALDLPDGEYLCALALIKRLFPVHLQRTGGKDHPQWGGPGFPGAIPWRPGAGTLDIRHWPSTSYIAAVPWLKRAKTPLIDDQKKSRLFLAAKKALQENEDLEPDHRKFMGETATTLFGLPPDQLFKLDGHLLHDVGIVAFVKERFADDKSNEAEKARSALLEALNETAKAIGGGAKGLYPSGFFAILRMDGDRIGELLEHHQDTIKTGLATFTASVRDYFHPDSEQGNPSLGALVYAGGDDVLAVLPVDTAITAARDIRDLYRKAFVTACKKDEVKAAEFTLSAAIVYSHFKSPLTAALRLSAELLDETAKAKNGRNSIALCIAKPGGVAAEWVSVFAEQAKAASDAALQIDDAACNGLTKKVDALLSGGFFHGLRDRYLSIMPGEIERKQGEVATDALLRDGGALLKALIGADLRRQFGSNVYKDIDDAVAVDAVYRILRPECRDENGDPELQKTVAFDGGMIVRFLAMERRTAVDAGGKEDELAGVRDG
ncbi:CRISPR-associated protein Cmr2 [Rhodobium orientis]|uniref:Type III-B CRISPR-associated protein Cas10/Cmr2 n=1 Tax=Rhodobium orientis TaxID=34017 RepID=A0A327JJN1_9HYPH|nr:type III-B CRISPR-associated protein Cas10/Cmr2 [Rhodobium orientis]MBB4302846.1 CRISPR-associated protein Cmr2 [Rhodobium orientis]RAI26251.1 type III-B CRISPR-associated protein Cas10/Cmr2 [Rhodobium orientis]